MCAARESCAASIRHDISCPSPPSCASACPRYTRTSTRGSHTSIRRRTSTISTSSSCCATRPPTGRRTISSYAMAAPARAARGSSTGPSRFEVRGHVRRLVLARGGRGRSSSPAHSERDVFLSSHGALRREPSSRPRVGRAFERVERPRNDFAPSRARTLSPSPLSRPGSWTRRRRTSRRRSRTRSALCGRAARAPPQAPRPRRASTRCSTTMHRLSAPPRAPAGRP